MPDAILTLDMGTSSTRAALYTADTAEALPFIHSVPHEPETTAEGAATLSAPQLLAETLECLEAIAERAADYRIVAVAACSLWHSAVGVDSNGTALTPVLLWSDTRSRAQVAQLRSEPDAPDYVQRTGCPLHTSYLPGRLLHLRETEPALFARCVRFLSPLEYVFAQLFGLDHVTCSVSMASASGLFDQTAQRWDTGTLQRIALSPEQLSPIDDRPVSGLRSPYRELLPRLAELPFFPALGDGACSNIGCGASTPERLALMIGTSGAMRVLVAGAAPPPVPPGLWRYQLAKGRFLLGGALTNGGAVWSWLKETLFLPHLSPEAFGTALSSLPADGHGLTVLPFFQGERAPLWRDDLRAMVHGLSAATTPLEIVRAHLEAVAFRFAALREALRPAAPTAELLGTGAGLLASPAWAQIIADALGDPLHLSAERQASSRGAALMARERLGYGTVTDAPSVPVTQTLLPDPAKTAVYQEARARQERLLQAVLDFA